MKNQSDANRARLNFGANTSFGGVGGGRTTRFSRLCTAVAVAAADRHGVLCAGWLSRSANRRCPSVLTSNIRSAITPVTAYLDFYVCTRRKYSDPVVRTRTSPRRRLPFLCVVCTRSRPVFFADVPGTALPQSLATTDMTAPSRLPLIALFCVAAALAVRADVYFEENFDDGKHPPPLPRVRARRRSIVLFL